MRRTTGKSFYTYLTIVVLGVLLVGILVLSIVISKRQTINSRAAEPLFPQLTSSSDSISKGRIPKPMKILEVAISYNSTTSPNYRIDSVKRKNGYVPTSIDQDSRQVIQLIASDGTLLYETHFIVPTTIQGPPPLPGEATIKDSLDRRSVAFTLTIPSIPEASAIVLFQNGVVQLRYPLASKVEDIDNRLNFNSIRGDEAKGGIQGMIKRIIPSADAVGGLSLDIAIVGDKYTDMARFQADADTIISHSLTYEPYKTRASQIFFHLVQNTSDLKCAPDSQIQRLLLCDDQLVTAVVNTAGAPHDTIYVLVNTPTYGGSGSNLVSTGYNGSYIGPMFAHESMGHGVGRLLDEYNEGSIGTIDNKVHGLIADDGNCYAGTPPAAVWQSIISINEYQLGCRFANWYRSSSSSIMLTLSDTTYNKVSQGVINRRLDAFTGVNLTPTPTTSQQLTGTPAPNSIKISVSLLLHGIGAAGDNVTPGTGGNLNPLTQQRSVVVQFLNSQNTVVAQSSGTVTYNSSTGDFKGTIDAGSNLPSTDYQIKIKTPNYLTTQIGSFFSLSQGQTRTLPQTSLVVGDSNNDNQLNILDYNIVIDCYSVFEPAKNCDSIKQKSADLNDDGKVNTIDTTLWQREISVQSGR